MQKDQGRIYFLSAKGTKFVKIGFTQDLKKRVAELQTSSPYELILLKEIKGSFATEQFLLRLFGASRVRGEWFVKTKALTTFIARLKAGALFVPSDLLEKI